MRRSSNRPLRIHLIAFEDLRPGTAAYGNTHSKLRYLADRHGAELVVAEPADRRVVRYWRALHLAAQARRGGIAYHRNFPLTPLAALLSGRRHLVVELNGPPTDATTAFPWMAPMLGLYVRLQRALLTRSRLIVVATTGLAELARNEAPGVPVVIAPAAAPAVSTPDIERNTSQVVYFGTFAPWQGAELLLEAIDHPAWPEGVNLVLVGDTSRSPVGQRLERHPRVIARGRLPHDQTLAIVAGSLCSLSPKTYQLDADHKTGLWPVKVIESLSVATPVVATAIEDQRSLVLDSQGGIVIEPSGVELAQAVRRLAADPEVALKMGLLAQEHVEAHHSLEARAALLIEHLRLVAEG